MPILNWICLSFYQESQEHRAFPDLILKLRWTIPERCPWTWEMRITAGSHCTDISTTRNKEIWPWAWLLFAEDVTIVFSLCVFVTQSEGIRSPMLFLTPLNSWMFILVNISTVRIYFLAFLCIKDLSPPLGLSGGSQDSVHSGTNLT